MIEDLRRVLNPPLVVVAERRSDEMLSDAAEDAGEACLGDGGCDGYLPDDQGWGRGNRPVIDISWEYASGALPATAAHFPK
jgi:hypothetical protein